MKILGQNITFRVLERLKDLRKLPHGCEIIVLDHWYTVIHFYSKADYVIVLTEGPWIVLGHYLMVTTCQPNFCPSAAIISSTLVWVQFLQMPIEFFNREVLIHMGNQIGTTTKVDEATASVLHGRFGRFYVEIDVNKPLIPCVRLMGRVQRVEYEGLHVICFNCGQYGQ